MDYQLIVANGNIPWQALRPHPIEGMYAHEGNYAAGVRGGPYAPLTGVPDGVEMGVDDVHISLPTGEDEYVSPVSCDDHTAS